jgi:GAF domain-containing protein
MAVSIQQQVRLVGSQFADGGITHEEARLRLVTLLKEHFDCSRVSYWTFSGEPGQRVMECVVMSGVQAESHRVGRRFNEADAPEYIASLARRTMYVCEDTLADPNFEAVRERFMQPGASRALLDAALSANGKLIGVLCCEQVGATRQWTRPEIVAAMKFATGISMYIARANAEATRLESVDQGE